MHGLDAGVKRGVGAEARRRDARSSVAKGCRGMREVWPGWAKLGQGHGGPTSMLAMIHTGEDDMRLVDGAWRAAAC